MRKALQTRNRTNWQHAMQPQLSQLQTASQPSYWASVRGEYTFSPHLGENSGFPRSRNCADTPTVPHTVLAAPRLRVHFAHPAPPNSPDPANLLFRPHAQSRFDPRNAPARKSSPRSARPAASPSNCPNWCKAGVDVFRLNMAHGEPDAQQVHVDNIRQLSDELDRADRHSGRSGRPEDPPGRVAGRPHLLRDGRRVLLRRRRTPRRRTN